MDDVDKLSCKEELNEMSDVENSADDHKEAEKKPKKKTRRKREIDMIKLSDDDDDDSEDDRHRKKHANRLSPARHSSSSPAASREPRTCVLKASQKRRPLSRLLEQLLRNLEKRDPNQFFAWPVNDNFAPNYSNIIKKPMDFSTIKQKIDDNEYKSLNCFISDFKLMCNNAMKYNKPGTVYHKAARRLLHIGLKQLTPQKLRPLGNILTYMYEIPIRELGFDIGKMDVHKVLKRSSPLKSGGSEAETVSDEGGAEGAGDRRKMRMEAARERHRRRLAKKAFPRMDSEGKTTLCIATRSEDDRRVTLGHYLGKIQHGTGTLHTLREDRRNLVKGVTSLQYGPFGSFAPSYDTTFATLTKEESHLLYHTLPSETGQGNEELLRFAPDSPWAAIYDMDLLFPVKGGAVDAKETKVDDSPSPVKVDIDSLRSLSELGVDVDFLNDIEDDVIASQKDYGLAAALHKTYNMIRQLEKEQNERLSQPLPSHLSLTPGPSPLERGVAQALVTSLRVMAAGVTPRALVDHCATRAAMGVTLRHLDTPLSVDELTEMETEPRDTSDPDSRSSQDLK